MKKRVILGVILIIIAIGGTIVMNTAGIFKGTPYYTDKKTAEYDSFYIFYNNTYDMRTYINGELKYSSNGFYKKDGTHIEVDEGYQPVWINGGIYYDSERMMTTQGTITAFVYRRGEDKYINQTAIWLQIGFGAVLIIGIIEIVVAGMTKKKKS